MSTRWPPRLKNANNAITKKKLDKVGTFPKFGSIIFAIESPADDAIFSPVTEATENKILKIKIYGI